MNEKTFTLTLSNDEIVAIAASLRHTSADIAFNENSGFAKMMPVSAETLGELSSKFFAIANR